jgi:hypothetical protein
VPTATKRKQLATCEAVVRVLYEAKQQEKNAYLGIKKIATEK